MQYVDTGRPSRSANDDATKMSYVSVRNAMLV
jgi:hypothetical protein